MMRIFSVAAATIVIIATAATAFTGQPIISRANLVSSKTVLHGYVPDGMTPEQWKKQKERERQQEKNKNYAAVGPKSFKSRSLQSFQEQLEQGKAGHLMPVMFAKKQVKEGKIKPEDVPYMQRGGSWDNSDVKGAKKQQWTKTDKKYEAKASFWGGGGMDWTGQKARTGPGGRRAAPKKDQDEEKPKTKKLFGMF